MNLMLDIETLGTDSRAVVLSLGSVFLAPGYPSNYMTFASLEDMSSVNDQINELGRTVTGDTIAWWINKTSPEAKKAVFEASHAHQQVLMEGIVSWYDWLDETLKFHGKEMDDIVVWGNSAAFDVSIMESLLDDLGMIPPWKYFNVKCYRTLKGFHPAIKKPNPEIPHHAMHDALAQAKHLDAILKQMEASCTSSATTSSAS